MILLKETMENLLQRTSCPLKNEYDDAELNKLLNYWIVLDANRIAVQELTGESAETILYSKYYWSSRFVERYQALYGTDAGMEQMRFKILEEMDQEFDDGIDWEYVQRLEKGWGK